MTTGDKIVLARDEFSAPHTGPHLLITGGVHGDEFEPMAAIRQLSRLLADQHNRLMLLRGQVTLIPIVNEAAFVRGHRMASDDLDLARVCPGRPDGSITERTAHALTAFIRSCDYYIDLHTGGTELAVLPMTGYALHAQGNVLEHQRQMARAFNLPVIWGTSPALDGRSLSVARDANVPAIYAEYLGSATCNRAGVQAYIDGCLNVMRWLEMIELPAPPSQIKHVVEDSRPDSGHLQICNPSPMTGFFESHVALGDTVHDGQALGRVIDPLGRDVREIRAQHSGIVLVLRTFPRVWEGQSIGVVLETSSEVGCKLPNA